jgi:hypothetical protein
MIKSILHYPHGQKRHRDRWLTVHSERQCMGGNVTDPKRAGDVRAQDDSIAPGVANAGGLVGMTEPLPEPVRRWRWSANFLGVAVECAAEGRWLDDGGR